MVSLCGIQRGSIEGRLLALHKQSKSVEQYEINKVTDWLKSGLYQSLSTKK
jgi:hypothetical protein